MQVGAVGVLLSLFLCILKNSIEVIQFIRIDTPIAGVLAFAYRAQGVILQREVRQRYQKSSRILDRQLLSIDQVHDLLVEDDEELDICQYVTT